MDATKLPKLAYTIPEFSTSSGIGRTKIYEEIGSGRLKAAHVGKRTIITAKDAEAYMELLRAEAEAEEARTS